MEKSQTSMTSQIKVGDNAGMGKSQTSMTSLITINGKVVERRKRVPFDRELHQSSFERVKNPSSDSNKPVYAREDFNFADTALRHHEKEFTRKFKFDRA